MVLVDEADPSWHRRGMGFHQCVVPRQRGARRRRSVFLRVAEEHPFHPRAADDRRRRPGRGPASPPRWISAMLVDARGRKRRGSDSLARPGSASRSASAPTLSTASSSTWRSRRARRIADGGVRNLRARPSLDHASAMPVDGICPTIEALRHGRFMTERRIGDTVRVGADSSAGWATRPSKRRLPACCSGSPRAVPASSPATRWSRSIPASRSPMLRRRRDVAAHCRPPAGPLAERAISRSRLRHRSSVIVL